MRVEMFLRNGKRIAISECAIDWREKEKIRSEINTNYVKYRTDVFCVHVSYDLNGQSFAYYFINHGFDDYFFYSRMPIDLGDYL